MLFFICLSIFCAVDLFFLFDTFFFFFYISGFILLLYAPLSGHISWVLPGPAHSSPFPPGVCDGAGRWAQQSKWRRHALLSPLWRRCLRGAGGHYPVVRHGLRNYGRHHVCFLHHHTVSATICPHGTLSHSLHRWDEGWEDARKTCQVRLNDMGNVRI